MPTTYALTWLTADRYAYFLRSSVIFATSTWLSVDKWLSFYCYVQYNVEEVGLSNILLVTQKYRVEFIGYLKKTSTTSPNIRH